MMLIRNKLVLLFTGLVLAIQLAFSTFIYLFYSVFRRQEFYGQLQAKAQIFGRVLIGRHEVTHLLSARVRASDLLTLTDEQVSIYDAQSRLLFDNQNASYRENERRLLPILQAQPLVEFSVGQSEGIGWAFKDAGRPYYIFVTGFDYLGRSKRENLLMIILIGNMGAFGLILWAGRYFAGQFLRPLHEMAESVSYISAAHLHTRLDEGNQRDEIARLAITFNHLLQDLERTFESQRDFVSHASHELRTPLTNVLGILDTSLMYDRTPEDWKGSMQSAIEEIKKMIALTNSLLSLAKATGNRVTLSPIRLDECLLEVVAQVQRQYINRSIELSFEGIADEYSTVNGNESLMSSALLNILENACKYSEKDIHVALSKEVDKSEKYIVTVIDHGRGIPPDDLKHLFEPLRRGSNVGTVAGFGIGLAIARQLILLQGGTIKVDSVYGVGEGRDGTMVRIDLPVCVSS